MIENEAPLLANSIWTATAKPFLASETFKSSKNFDVAVVGGGFSGVSTALHCVNYGLTVCVIEKETIGWGASGRNGGQVIPGLKELPETILSFFGNKTGEKIVRLAGDAPDYVFKLISKNNIQCDASQDGWIQASIGKHGLSSNKKVYHQWHKRGAPVQLLSGNEIRDIIGSNMYSGGVVDSRGGKIHPLNYVLGLAKIAQNKGAAIYQNSPVLRIGKHNRLYSLDCPGGQILADKVVITTNGYGEKSSKTMNRNIVPVQSVQVATEPLSDNVLKTILPKGHVVSDTRRLLKYFRVSSDGRLMMGGRGGTNANSTKIQIEELKRFAQSMFPQIGDSKFEYSWGGNIALTLNHFPQISMLSNGIITLSGYNGRGVAMATVLGKVVADFLSGLPAEDLSFPIQPLKVIPFPKLQQTVVPLAAWYKKLLDELNL